MFDIEKLNDVKKAEFLGFAFYEKADNFLDTKIFSIPVKVIIPAVIIYNLIKNYKGD